MKDKVDYYVVQKVRERREELDISQEALSYALNFNRSFINYYENGPGCYNVKQLNKIAHILKCSPRDFMPKEPLL